ncbi:hypothetical protein AA13595_0057 [Gluconacetobacter johannae DSM 13595]|uniref:Uncharacterized protein n=1 Tax=Gluconacetobacter johannae TaxID=112140 RepID=A0A7W4J8P4_9PROT|nr:hypothetical protein [Gluconacetobacter johannae]MBB2176740.1 hypothetical protein [Gluconacetobacter johannae]GBQ79550.1 hypothetical protein AA13595_0057 [Gluconacetobacter johannae DSM 13595]
MDRAKLLHAAMVNGHPVRFYKTPHDEGQYPWHDHEALLTAIGFDPDDSAPIIADTIQAAPSLIVRVICPATTRQVVIADNMLANTLFSTAPIGMPFISSGFGEYRDALAEAVGLLTGALRDPEDRATWLTNAWLHDQGKQQMPPELEHELRQMARVTGRTLFDPGSNKDGSPAGTRSTIH